MSFSNFQHEFLIRLASVWLGARLAAMGGTPGFPQHIPVQNFPTLAWAMLGYVDYGCEMRLLCHEVKTGMIL